MFPSSGPPACVPRDGSSRLVPPRTSSGFRSCLSASADTSAFVPDPLTRSSAGHRVKRRVLRRRSNKARSKRCGARTDRTADRDSTLSVPCPPLYTAVRTWRFAFAQAPGRARDTATRDKVRRSSLPVAVTRSHTRVPILFSFRIRVRKFDTVLSTSNTA